MATKQSGNGWLKRNRRLLLIGGPVLFALVAAYVYFTGGRYISTDDAYIQSARTEISANIEGRVVELRVHDNQEVSAGEVLFTLDDRDLAIAVGEAKAKLAVARLQIAALKSTYQQRQAGLQEANDTLAYQQQELERQKTLAGQGISSQAQLELARHAVASAEQQVNAVVRERETIRASLGDNPELKVDEHPSVRLAQAALDRAELNLTYTVIKAPAAGIVTKVELLQAGSYIKAATPVFALVSEKDVWVEANFKETDLTYMRAGQDATIQVDAYPERTFHGKVASTSPGTGSSFSLLPPENATGNWVKVVQRLPVRVSLDDADPELRLHAGLSATVEVDTHHRRLGKKD